MGLLTMSKIGTLSDSNKDVGHMLLFAAAIVQ